MYCTLEDIKKYLPAARIIELTDDEGLGAVDQAKVDEAIDTAQAEVDGYLQERYQIPLDPVPALIRKITADIAILILYSRQLDDVPDGRQKQYVNAVRRLEKIATGAVSLGLASPPDETNAGGMQVEAPEQIFTSEELDTF